MKRIPFKTDFIEGDENIMSLESLVTATEGLRLVQVRVNNKSGNIVFLCEDIQVEDDEDEEGLTNES